MTRATYRFWLPRLVFGAAVGFALHVGWERHASARVATRLLGHATGALLRSSPPRNSTSASRPDRFSLDAIAAAADPAAELRRWREKLEAMTPEARLDALNGIVDVTGPGLHAFLGKLAGDAALREELNRWSKLVEHIIAQGGPTLERRAMIQLAQLDLALALDAAEAMQSQTALNAVLTVMAETDPAGAIRLAKERGLTEGSRELFGFALLVQSLRDPSAAFALFGRSNVNDSDLGVLLATRPPQQVLAACREWFTSAGVSDSDAGALLGTLPPEHVLAVCRNEAGGLDPSALSSMLKSLPATRARDFLEALKTAAPDDATALEFAPKLAARMAQAEPAAALSWLQTETAGGRWPDSTSLSQILKAVAWNDAPAALELASRCPDEDSRVRAKQAAFTSWLDHDPAAAFAALAKHPDTLSIKPDRELTSALNSLPRMSSFDPRSLATAMTPFEPNPTVNSLIAFIAVAWSEADPASAAQWAAQTGNYRAVANVFCAWADRDSDAAHQAAMSFPPATRAKLALSASQLTPSQRLELLNDVPAESLPPAKRIAWQFGSSDEAALGAAVNWLQRQPADYRHAALDEILRAQTTSGRSETAAALLPAIEDPAERFDWERRIYESMIRAGK